MNFGSLRHGSFRMVLARPMLVVVAYFVGVRRTRTARISSHSSTGEGPAKAILILERAFSVYKKKRLRGGDQFTVACKSRLEHARSQAVPTMYHSRKLRPVDSAHACTRSTPIFPPLRRRFTRTIERVNAAGCQGRLALYLSNRPVARPPSGGRIVPGGSIFGRWSRTSEVCPSKQ